MKLRRRRYGAAAVQLVSGKKNYVKSVTNDATVNQGQAGLRG